MTNETSRQQHLNSELVKRYQYPIPEKQEKTLETCQCGREVEGWELYPDGICNYCAKHGEIQ